MASKTSEMDISQDSNGQHGDESILINTRAFNKLKMAAKNSDTFGAETPMVERRPDLQVLVGRNGERANSSNNARGTKTKRVAIEDINMIALNSSSEETFGVTPGAH
jgi:hypothetical protein